MASLKEIKGRIASIQNTQKITSAMRMVASAKLHRAQGMTEKFLHYRDELQLIVDRLQSTEDTQTSNLKPQTSNLNYQQSTTLLIPVSSSSGLCGAFNSNITKATLQRIDALEAAHNQVRLLPIGKKIAHDLQDRGFDCNIGYYNLLDKIEKHYTYAEVTYLVEYAQQLYQNDEIDHVEFLYHHFQSMSRQDIRVDSLQLTVDPSVQPEETSNIKHQTSNILTEPSPQELLQSLLPRLLNVQVYGILLDSLTSEHASRMLAMQTADDNANELLKELRLLYNKTRQQAITNELIDIMGGQVGKQ